MTDSTPKVISSISDVDLQWLQAVLDRECPDSNLTISSFSVESASSTNASTAAVRLTYDGNKSGPASLFLKFCGNDGHFVKDSEYFYYKRDYDGLKEAPIPICYDAQYSDRSGAYHILLEDLSRTHYSNKEIKPTLDHALSVSTELARLHAFRWGRKSDALNIDTNADSHISTFIAHVAKNLPYILQAAGNDIPRLWQNTLQDIFRIHPDLMKRRAANLAGQTLIHGDPNPSNILSPHDPKGKTYIVDRQPFTWSLQYWLGVCDLVYMSVPYWDAEDRRALEKAMLKKYHESLLRFGVTGYSWEECRQDYRLCIAHGVYVAVQWGENEDELKNMKWLWEKQLRRSMTAFHDWKCEELHKSS